MWTLTLSHRIGLLPLASLVVLFLKNFKKTSFCSKMMRVNGLLLGWRIYSLLIVAAASNARRFRPRKAQIDASMQLVDPWRLRHHQLNSPPSWSKLEALTAVPRLHTTRIVIRFRNWSMCHGWSMTEAASQGGRRLHWVEIGLREHFDL